MAAPERRTPRAIRLLNPSREEQEIRLGWRMAGLGMQVASEVGAGALLGWLVDWRFHTDPWGLVTGGAVGIVVGLTSLLVSAWRLNKELDRKPPSRGE